LAESAKESSTNQSNPIAGIMTITQVDDIKLHVIWSNG